MKKSTRLLVTLMSAMVLSSCATIEKMDKPTYERLYKKADAALKKADSINYVWTTAENALDNAKNAAESGDWENAIKQARISQQQSELSYRQHQAEQDRTPVFD